jgi:rhodanese-related sulfurtransferase
MKLLQPLLFTAVMILVFVLFFDPLSLRKQENSPLEVSAAEAKSRRFGFIIDVRTPEQRNRLGYYPNSVPISLERIQDEVPLDISNKKTWILVYSNGDERARFAAEKLFSQGYPNVRHLKGNYLSLMPGSQ